MTFGAFFQENLWSFVLLSVVVGMLIVIEKKRMNTQVPKISALLVASKMEQGALLLDIRDAANFKLGHIAGAKNQPKLLEQLAQYHDKTQAIILCDESGLRAPNLANQMQAQGFSSVMVLHNGMQGWLEENFPVVK
ncbi:MAG: rhodanese-like domain-containing protein [Cardiobacteriaceae bacterium]|nr:rhodanese-like domain-containing protein [Cardiobacteriaceae bacterium]